MSGAPSLTAVVSALHRAWSLTLGRVLGWVLIGLIRFYQLVISPLTPPTCRFHPSCSAYALGSVRRHGPVKGFLLSSWRVLRCNPWNRGGIDPVPRRGHWLPDVLPNGEPRHGSMGIRASAES